MRSTWFLRTLAIAGLTISVYLLTLKLTGRISYLVGCGEGSGCANVLGSRWSQFFYIPVTALSAAMYAGLLAATWKPLKPVYAGLAICFAGAALWFYGLLIFAIKEFCPWCTTAHLIGLTCAVVLIWKLRKEKTLPGNIHLGVVGGFMAMLLFIIGQLGGPVPDTHAVSTETVEAEDKSVIVHARGEGRTISVFDDKKSYNTSTLPHLGPADAPHVVVKYFDFTCSSCRDMHNDLSMVVKKHPGKFCIIMLPVPLNRSCNPHFPTDQPPHEHACELTRLALAAWRAKPQAYPKVHQTLFTRPVLTPDAARDTLEKLVGEDALKKSLEDPWVDEVIAANINDFRQLIAKTVSMPKLLVGKNRMLHGLTNSPEILLLALEKEFKLSPSP